MLNVGRPHSWPLEVAGIGGGRYSLDGGEMYPKQVHWGLNQAGASAFHRPANFQYFNPQVPPPPLPLRRPQPSQSGNAGHTTNVMPALQEPQEYGPTCEQLQPTGVENVQQMMERMEALERQLGAMDVANLHQRPPTFTEIYIEPPAGVAFTGLLNGREYFLQNFEASSDNKTENAAACKTFLQDAMSLGASRCLSHSSCVTLINRHTRKAPKAIVANEMRDPDMTLESVVRALELRFMGLVDPDTAKGQMYAVVREPGEDLHSLKNRIYEKAQMATRKRPRDLRVREEQAHTSSRFLACLPSAVRNIIRERERMRKGMGREPYTLAELVEEAIIVESEYKDGEHEEKGGKELGSDRSYALVLHQSKTKHVENG